MAEGNSKVSVRVSDLLAGRTRGGAFQLAQALGSRVSEEPERFARLSLRFPSDTNPIYLTNILTALNDAPVATNST